MGYKEECGGNQMEKHEYKSVPERDSLCADARR